MNVKGLIVIWLFCLGVSAPKAFAQGFAGLGADSEGFADVVKGRPVTFPDDFGPHPDYRIEWWYVTANLTTDDGRPLGLQWTLFRQATKPGPAAEGWSNHEFWMGHAAVTTQSDHRFAEKLARGGTGQAGAKPVPFGAWIDDWQFAKSDAATTPEGAYRLKAGGDDFHYDLTLVTGAPPILHGDKGFSRKSAAGHASYYFSIPSFTVSGTVIVGGETHTVDGTAWLDREWSSQPLSGSQQGWDWFSLSLDGGDKLMLFQLRDRDNPPFLSGTWISKDGEAKSLEGMEMKVTPLETTRIDGRDIPIRWSIDIPSKSLKLETNALWPHSWMNTSIAYWEGPVTATGSHTATGYLEMTGY